MSIHETDKASAAVATAPRVSLASIEGKIKRTHTFTLGQALSALGHPKRVQDPFDIMTVCVIEMQNGFIVFGKSAPASPENFNASLGSRFAREDAIRQLWQLEGYLLRENLSAFEEP